MDNKPPSKPINKPPGCNDCSHYFITHDPNFRYGCRAFDFKSQRQPILDVIESSGQECQYFQKKVARPK
jgi:hypothetical protein